jgi:hypothetical protein
MQSPPTHMICGWGSASAVKGRATLLAAAKGHKAIEVDPE